jgi:mycothiol synthase
MPDSRVKIRTYEDDDFSGYLALQVASKKLDSTGRLVTARSLKEDLERPNFNPQTDLWVADLNGKLIGSLSISREPAIGRAVLDGCVHPLQRRGKIATELFSAALQRIRAAGIPAAHVSIPETNAPARHLLDHLGFSLIRYFVEMQLAIDSARMPAIRKNTTASCSLAPAEARLLTEIQNRCFADSWGFNPNTEEEIAYRLKMQSRSPQDVILTYLGDQPIGYCWTIINTDKNANRKESNGLIHMLGVDPDYRQQDIGKAVLRNGLEGLKARGIDIVRLTVDNENTVALSLYESVGFDIYAKTAWYEKILIQ